MLAILLSILIFVQIVITGLLIKLNSTVKKQLTVSSINSVIDSKFKNLASEFRVHNDSNFEKVISKIDTEMTSAFDELESRFLSQQKMEFQNRILPEIKNSLSPESLSQIINRSLNDKAEVNEWGNIISNNPEDFHLMEIAVNKYAGELDLSKEVYNKLIKEYKEEKNIGIKRELLKLLDTLTENMLFETSPSDYKIVREMKISVEKLYSDITSEIKELELSVIQKKISELQSLISKVNNITIMRSIGELTQKINKIDSSIDVNLLRTDENLSAKYDTALNVLSHRIDNARNQIIKKENSELIKKTDRILRVFNETKKNWDGEYPERLINILVKDLSIHEFENLLPSTYEYSEKIRVQLVDKLNDAQKKEYAVKSIDYKFNGTIL